MVPYLLYQVGIPSGGPPPATVGFASILAPWTGGAGAGGTAPPPPATIGFTSILGGWIGGAAGDVAPPIPPLPPPPSDLDNGYPRPKPSQSAYGNIYHGGHRGGDGEWY